MSYCEIIIGPEKYMALEDNPAEPELTEDASIADPTKNEIESTAPAGEVKYFWDRNCTLLLISLIGDRYDDIYHPVRRKTVWDNISNDMANNNVEVSSKCCFQKWKSLLRTYKQTKDNCSTKFQFIDQMEELMSTKGADSDDDEFNAVHLKPKALRLKAKAQKNTVFKTSMGAKAAYFREKWRYLNNKEKRKEMLENLRFKFAERTVKLQQKMIELQEKKFKMYHECTTEDEQINFIFK